MTAKIAYLVHDLNDAAVHRRVDALRRGGADVAVAGFYRREPISEISGAPAMALSQSHDAGFLQRVLVVLIHLVRRDRLRGAVADAPVVISRNLEMLFLAASVIGPGQRLVFECLDIHRLMLRRDLVGRMLRWLERRLLARCNLVLISSPAYRREYFRAMQGYRGEILLVENKVLEQGRARASSAPAKPVNSALPGPPSARAPWRIGWFGMLRCRRSLDLLCELAERSAGDVEILIAGRPSPTVLADLEVRVAQTRGVAFAGPYDPRDLARLYRSIHFSWCIDFFEEGLNSSWLLPNRLYEGIANGAVPVALEAVETGRWLADADLGLRLRSAATIGAELAAMTPSRFAGLSRAVDRFPRGEVAFRPDDHRELVRRLGPAA